MTTTTTTTTTRPESSLASSSDVVHPPSLDPIFFPPTNNPNGGEAIDENGPHLRTFSEACQFAAENHRPLHLLCDVEGLQETIVLRKRQFLTIRGVLPHSSLSSSLSSSPPPAQSPPKRIRISGNPHSLFLLNNHSRLSIVDLELVHEEDDIENSDCRRVGAAVNLRYKSSVDIRDSLVTSHAGFCCWAVQKASVHLERSVFSAPLRSALVCFGQTRLEAVSSTIAETGVHGVCARGECVLFLVDCSVLDAAVRGLYAYANASVVLEGCSFRRTVRPDKAAIEVSSAVPAPSDNGRQNQNQNQIQIQIQIQIQAGPLTKTKDKTKAKTDTNAKTKTKTSSLIMRNCRITDNAGVGVRIRGGVDHDILCVTHGEKDHHEHFPGENANYFARNAGGNEIDFLPSSGEGDNVVDTNDIANSNGNADTNANANTNTNQSSEGMIQAPKRDASGSSFRKGDWWCPRCLPQRVVQGSRDSCRVCGADKQSGRLLSTREVIQLNRGTGIGTGTGMDTGISACTFESNPGIDGGGGGDGGGDGSGSTRAECKAKAKVNPVQPTPARAQDAALGSTAAAAADTDADTAAAATWWFDADGDVGWVPYDAESTRTLELAFRSLRFSCHRTETLEAEAEAEAKAKVKAKAEAVHPASSSIVLLSNGKYRVDLETMEQTNTESHFLRLVQRRENDSRAC